MYYSCQIAKTAKCHHIIIHIGIYPGDETERSDNDNDIWNDKNHQAANQPTWRIRQLFQPVEVQRYYTNS